jgi:hypothetical protein
MKERERGEATTSNKIRQQTMKDNSKLWVLIHFRGSKLTS